MVFTVSNSAGITNLAFGLAKISFFNLLIIKNKIPHCHLKLSFELLKGAFEDKMPQGRSECLLESPV